MDGEKEIELDGVYIPRNLGITPAMWCLKMNVMIN